MLNQNQINMSDEIKEFAPVSEEGPVFDPKKKYTWNSDIAVVLTGAEFGQILNSLRAITSTPEAIALFRAAEATVAIEDVLARNVNNGNIVEAQEAPKNSL